MKAKTKKMLFIGGLIAAAIGLIVYIKKKKAAKANEAAPATVASSTAATTKTTVAAKPATAATPVKTTVTTTTVKTTAPAVKTAKFTSVLSNSNKANLIGVSGLGLKNGDMVNVASPLYNGKFKVYYLYEGTKGVQNVYIETPFKGTSTGTIAKA